MRLFFLFIALKLLYCSQVFAIDFWPSLSQGGTLEKDFRVNQINLEKMKLKIYKTQKSVVSTLFIDELKQNEEKFLFYKTKKNETLMMIAWKIFGDYRRWKELFEINREIIKEGKILPENLHLKYPKCFGVIQENQMTNGDNVYLIKYGDTFSSIACRYYKCKDWWDLWNYNNPPFYYENLIFAGFTLNLPKNFETIEVDLNLSPSEIEVVKAYKKGKRFYAIKIEDSHITEIYMLQESGFIKKNVDEIKDLQHQYKSDTFEHPSNNLYLRKTLSFFQLAEKEKYIIVSVNYDKVEKWNGEKFVIFKEKEGISKISPAENKLFLGAFSLNHFSVGGIVLSYQSKIYASTEFSWVTYADLLNYQNISMTTEVNAHPTYMDGKGQYFIGLNIGANFKYSKKYHFKWGIGPKYLTASKLLGLESRFTLGRNLKDPFYGVHQFNFIFSPIFINSKLLLQIGAAVQFSF